FLLVAVPAARQDKTHALRAVHRHPRRPVRCQRTTGTTARGPHPRCRGCGPQRVLTVPSSAGPYRARGPVCGLLADQAPQHVLQDAAVAVVVGLTRGVDAYDRVELHAGVGGDLHRAGGGAVVQLGHAGDGEGLLAGQAEGVGRVALRELQRQDAHADEVRAVDALVGLGDDGLDAEQRGALGRPVAGRAGTVLLARQDDQRDAGGLVVLRGVVDEGDRAAVLREVAGVAALGARRYLVAQADVGERAADHDLVVAAARAVAVEVA